VSGSLFCSDVSQTATSVSIGEPPASAFTPPSGIEFKDDPDLQNPDSLARGYVAYLASQELSDSLAAAKAKLAEAQQGQAQQAQQAQPQMTPEQQKQACEALKNFSLGKMMGQAAKAVLNQAIEAKKEEMKEKGVNKVKGLIKKPRFP
jgi:hypothetical protein